MRFINVLLLVIVASTLAAWLKRQKHSDYAIVACSVLVVPMTWVVAGMALSEMSAMVFVTLSLYLQLRGLTALHNAGGPVLRWFFASGVCLGVAVWGRQPYLLLVSVPVLMALLDRRLRVPVLVLIAVVIGLAIPLFVIWEGLVPPSHHNVQQGLSLTHGLISLGYTGICFLLLAPQSRWIPLKALIGLIVVVTAVNTWSGAFVLYPIRSVADRYLPASVVSGYGILCGSLFLTCGIAFLALLVQMIWAKRGDLRLVALNAGLLCLAVSPMFVAHQSSSRYAAMSLPYLVLAAQPWREWRLATVITAVLGCALGFLSLFGYFSQ